jgi:uncharacterized membrane protein YdjX (TVP38/TMEM64 family)
VKARLALVALALALLAVAWRAGWLTLFADPESLRTTLVALGPLGYGAYLAAFTFLQPLGVPGIGFVLGATFVWSKPVAFALSVAGSMTSSTIGFGFARFVAREWVSARMPAWLRPWEARLAERGLATTAALRLVFLMNPFVNGLLGVSSISIATYLAGSLLGYVPALAVVVWVGAEVFEQVRAHPAAAAIAVAVLALVAGIGRALWVARARRRLRAAEPTEVEPPAP